MSDNLRWDALGVREGDIVISAPSKCGVTWTQRLVSLLVFGGPDLPGPMSMVSPWLDGTIRPIEEVVASLDAQHHRRFIKTHVPLDGLVLDDRVTYICVGRDPRDAAVSEYFSWDNMDLDRMRALQGAAPEEPPPGADRGMVQAFRQWLEGPIAPPDEMGLMPGMGIPPHRAAGTMPPEKIRERGFMSPARGIGSLANILHHFGTVWQQRQLPNVAMFHYADYRLDLAGEFVRLGQVLGYDLDRGRADELVTHAGLDVMRARAWQFAPNSTEGIWRSDERFFRSGAGGEWQQFFDEFVYRRYRHRINELAPPDLLAWAHEGRRGCDPAA
jgi:hypothetical protein